MQLLQNGKQQWIDSGGLPLANGTVGFYAVGTLNPLPTYQDQAGTIQNTNPIVLDSRGQAIVWGTGTYRQIVKDASGVTIWDQVVDAPAGGAAFGNTNGAGGAALVGFDGGTLAQFFLSKNNRVVDSIAGLRALVKTTYTRAFVTGYYAAGDGGGGAYWYDSTDTTSTDNGGTIIVASDGGRWKLATTSAMSIKQWGAKGDGVTSDQTALTNAAAWVVAKGSAGQSPVLIFPAGIYLYTTSPNWASWNARILAQGEVRLRCNGTGHSVIIDGTAATNGRVYSMEMGPFIVEGGSTTQDGVWVKQADHCKFTFNVRGAGGAYAGLRTLWCVASEFHFTCSGNENPAAIGFYNQPTYGIYLDAVTGSQTSYCTFYNPICERMSTGILLAGALGNLFIGGASEGCTSTGVQLNSTALQNKFFGTDFEANTTYDINCGGVGNEFHGCDTAKLLVMPSTAAQNKVCGGQHAAISIQAGANLNAVLGATYNRFNDGSAITDAGAKTRLADILNVGAGVYENVKVARTAITVGASPFTYTNATANDQTVVIVGGTVSAMALVRGANPSDVFTGGMVTLSPGDAVQVTYSAAPTMFSYTR